MKILLFAKPYILKHKVKFCVYVSLSIALWLLFLLSPYLTGNYVDMLLSHQNHEMLWKSISFLAILWLLQIILSYSMNIIVTALHSKIYHQITADLLTHITKLPISYLSKHNHAYLNQRISSDSREITAYILGDVERLLTNILTVVSTGAIVAALNMQVLIILSVLIPLYAIIYLVFKKSLYNIKHQHLEEYGQYYTTIDRLLSHIRIIKIHEWSTQFSDKITQAFGKLHKTAMKNATVGYILSNVDALVRCCVNIAIFAYSGFRIMDKELTIGEFAMINSYSAMIISCMSSILQFGKKRRQTEVAYDRVMALYKEPQEQCGTIRIDAVSEIAVNQLCFSYSDHAILNDVNFVFRKGNIYAVVGENGSGKSTLINILCGLEQNYTGRITYDGVDLTLLDHRYLKEHVLAISEQEPELIFHTLRENLTDRIVDEDRIRLWFSKFKMDDFLYNLEDEINYQINDKTSNLSGGEKQKVAIIRCLMKETDVLILDEPNSAFDSEGTKLLCQVLNNIKKEKIIIVVTHRSELVEISDRVISL